MSGRYRDGEVQQRVQSTRKAEERLMGGVCNGSCHIQQVGPICSLGEELYSFFFSSSSYFSSRLGPRSSIYCLLVFTADPQALLARSQPYSPHTFILR